MTARRTAGTYQDRLKAVLYSTRPDLTQARSVSEGTSREHPSLTLRACVKSPRAEYTNKGHRARAHCSDELIRIDPWKGGPVSSLRCTKSMARRTTSSPRNSNSHTTN